MSDEPVDIGNRFAVVVAALLVTFIALVVVLLAWAEPGGAIGRIEGFAGWLRDHETNGGKLVVTLAATVVALLMLTVIIVELTPSPTQRMRLRTVKAGDATLTTPQIAERIEAEALLVPGVADCQAIVAARGARVEVVLELQVGATAHLAQTADEVCRRTQQLVEQQMGIELAQRPRARLHYRELRLQQQRNVPEAMRRQDDTGWERPPAPGEGERDGPGQPDAPEEAQA